MQLGFFVLLFALGAVWLIDAIPLEWRKALGGLILLAALLMGLPFEF